MIREINRNRSFPDDFDQRALGIVSLSVTCTMKAGALLCLEIWLPSLCRQPAKIFSALGLITVNSRERGDFEGDGWQGAQGHPLVVVCFGFGCSGFHRSRHVAVDDEVSL
jgi:hypothetical protein